MTKMQIVYKVERQLRDKITFPYVSDTLSFLSGRDWAVKGQIAPPVDYMQSEMRLTDAQLEDFYKGYYEVAADFEKEQENGRL